MGLILKDWATRKEILPHIVKTIQHGEDWEGNKLTTVALTDGTQWDYIPEDMYYEKRIENLFIIS